MVGNYLGGEMKNLRGKHNQVKKKLCGCIHIYSPCRMHAAAPEMLKALRAALKLFQKLIPDGACLTKKQGDLYGMIVAVLEKTAK
jgi:hypothetical protein